MVPHLDACTAGAEDEVPQPEACAAAPAAPACRPWVPRCLLPGSTIQPSDDWRQHDMPVPNWRCAAPAVPAAAATAADDESATGSSGTAAQLYVNPFRRAIIASLAGPWPALSAQQHCSAPALGAWATAAG